MKYLRNQEEVRARLIARGNQYYQLNQGPALQDYYGNKFPRVFKDVGDISLHNQSCLSLSLVGLTLGRQCFCDIQHETNTFACRNLFAWWSTKKPTGKNTALTHPDTRIRQKSTGFLPVRRHWKAKTESPWRGHWSAATHKSGSFPCGTKNGVCLKALSILPRFADKCQRLSGSTISSLCGSERRLSRD
jgi:hypothetical protein